MCRQDSHGKTAVDIAKASRNTAVPHLIALLLLVPPAVLCEVLSSRNEKVPFILSCCCRFHCDQEQNRLQRLSLNA